MFNFKKKFGQNFLSDKNLLSAIVTDAGITQDDVVLEIGAGAGALTKELSTRAKKVVSYEIDLDLRETLERENLENVQFVFADFMKEDMKKVEENLSSFKVVANLPYYITTPIIFKLLEESEALTSLTIMVQKEVAERIVAKAGGKDYGILTVMIAFYGEAKITRIVKRDMFYPAPNVDSAVVRIDKKTRFDVDKDRFSKFVKASFSMRRKTLLNNLSTLYSKEKLKQTFSDDFLKKRAESISIEEFVEAFKKLEN